MLKHLFLTAARMLPLLLLIANVPYVRAQDRGPIPPNVVIIFIDDMGFADLSCFGNKSVKTPAIDRLAAEGLRFTQFYVNAPICSPSRCALITGQYPQRHRITSYLDHRAANARRGVADWLDPRTVTLARLLQRRGYATGHFGKWHLGGQRDVGDAPLITEYGFDESLTNFEGLGPRLLGLADAHDGKPAKRHALGSHLLGRGPVIWHDRSRLTEGFVSAALAFIEQAVAKDKPFHLNLWPDDVHSPFFPPRNKRGDGTKRELYRGVLQAMDAQLAPLFDHIRDNPRLRDNTLILLCSDNGHEPGAGSAGDLRGSKATLFEGGIRSPLIAWAPGLIDKAKAGSVDDSSVFAVFDLMPSILSITRTPMPQGLKLDGQDMTATLLGRAAGSRQEPLYWRRPPDRKVWPPMVKDPQPDLAMREGRWKLLCEYDGSKPMLFDLIKDAGESDNLAAKHPDITGRMTKALIDWHQAMPQDQGPELGRQARQ